MNLKTRDYVLLSYFRKNARENLTRISRLTNIPVSTIFDKLRDYEHNIIRKHTTLIDFKKLGFDIKAHLLIKISKENKDNFKDFILTSEHINSAFRINNGYDYLLEVVCKNMDVFQKFIEELENCHIESRQEMFILEDIKRETFLNDSKQLDYLLATR